MGGNLAVGKAAPDQVGGLASNWPCPGLLYVLKLKGELCTGQNGPPDGMKHGMQEALRECLNTEGQHTQ